MDTSKIYKDSEGNERTIHQMVKYEPEWAANRIQVGEKAIKTLANKGICEWEYDTDMNYYTMSCGGEFTVNDGTPSENGMKYCPYCGFEISEI